MKETEQNQTELTEKQKANTERLVDAMTDMDDGLLTAYEHRRVIRRRKLIRYASAAAVFLVCLVSIPVILHLTQNHDNLKTPTQETPKQEENENAKITGIDVVYARDGVIQNDTGFTVHTDGMTVETLEKRLYLTPSVDYTITENKDNTFTVQPKQAINDNTVITLAEVQNGAVANSWAFETEKRLSVCGTYPAADCETASVDTVIELEFSYASVENAESCISVSPAVSGSWSHTGRIWRFSPASPLAADTVYTVSVTGSLAADGQTLGDGYSFSFGTFEKSNPINLIPDPITDDDINTYRTTDPIVIRYIEYTVDGVENAVPDDIAIEQFSSADDLIKYASGNDGYKLSPLGTYSYQYTKLPDNYRNLTLDTTLGTGYYLAHISVGGVPVFNWIIEVNDHCAYTLMTERDLLVWAADANGLLKDATVTAGEKSQKTNADGYTTFEKIGKNDGSLIFVRIGTGDAPLIMGVTDTDSLLYPNGYVYTDRITYRNTDEIQVWGFVPLDYFPEGDYAFQVSLGSGEQVVDVKPDADGSFTAKLTLQNRFDGNTSVRLTCNGTEIADRYINIENDSKQYYRYEITPEMNCIYQGQSIGVDITVTHLSGLPAIQKQVLVTWGSEHKETMVTDDSGHIHFTYTDESTYKSSSIETTFITVSNGAYSEYTDDNVSAAIHVIVSEQTIDYDYDQKGDGLYRFTLYNLESEGVWPENGEEGLYASTYDTTVTVEIYEYVNTRVQTGTEYNAFTKQNEPVYSWTQVMYTVTSETVATKNGAFTVDTTKLSRKKNTEDKKYSYSINVSCSNQKGRQLSDSVTDTYGTPSDIYNTSDNRGYQAPNFYCRYNYPSSYCNYNYYLDIPNPDGSGYKYAEGETVPVTLKSWDGINVADGRVLRILSRQSILKVTALDGSDLSLPFDETCFPNVNLTAVYYQNGVFYRTPSVQLTSSRENRKLTVAVTPDKTAYQPGDAVTLTVKTTDANGKGVAASVNVSVADQASFEPDDDFTNLDTILDVSDIYYAYTASNFRDYSLYSFEGGYGGGGGVRANFGDTAHFSVVKTDADGNGTVTFTLPDNVTDWRITAQAANRKLYRGSSVTHIEAGLDFFIQQTDANGVKATDDLVISASTLSKQSADVAYTIAIKETAQSQTASGKTGHTVSANFGKLAVGTYTVSITAVSGDKKDAVEYPVTIVESAQQLSQKTTVALTDSPAITPAQSPVLLELCDKQTSERLALLSFMQDTCSPRLDTRVGSRAAAQIRNNMLGEQNAVAGIKIYQYVKYITRSARLSALEDGDGDWILTALTKYAAPELINGIMVDGASDGMQNERQAAGSLLYRAMWHESVLSDLTYAAAHTSGDVYTKAILAAGFAAIGDYKSAEALYAECKDADCADDGYAALVAFTEAFLHPDDAKTRLLSLIETKPAELYLDYAIIAYFDHCGETANTTRTVTVSWGDKQKTVTVNALSVAKLYVNDADASSIAFSGDTKDMTVTYSYRSTVENANPETVKNTVKASIDGTLTPGSTATLTVDLSGARPDCGEIRIALPPSLRLDTEVHLPDGYYLSENSVDYLIFYRGYDRDGNVNESSFTVPLTVGPSGNYEMEPVVCFSDGISHVSQSFTFDVS